MSGYVWTGPKSTVFGKELSKKWEFGFYQLQRLQKMSRTIPLKWVVLKTLSLLFLDCLHASVFQRILLDVISALPISNGIIGHLSCWLIDLPLHLRLQPEEIIFRFKLTIKKKASSCSVILKLSVENPKMYRAWVVWWRRKVRTNERVKNRLKSRADFSRPKKATMS